MSVRKVGLRLTIDPELAEQVTTALTFTFAVRVSPRGYQLALFQGGKRVSRLRVSGRCKHVGGFITCSHRRARMD